MTSRTAAAVSLLSLTLFATQAFADDKLAFYGLGPDGKPLVEETGETATDVVVFHGNQHPTAVDSERPSFLAPIVSPQAHEHFEVPVARPQLAALAGATLEERVRALVAILAEGPTTQEQRELCAEPLFPAGTRIADVTLTDANVVEIRAEFPEEYLSDLRRGQQYVDNLAHLLSDNIFLLPVSGFMLYALDSETNEFVPIESFEPEDENRHAEWAPDTATPPETWFPEEDENSRRNAYPRPSGGRPVGGLSNRRVYLNAGHGWTYRANSESWGVQRTFVHNNIEDFSNSDLVHGWINAYLYRAGADVFHVREMDPNPNMVIVDNDDGSPDYVETGSWSTSSVSGFANGHIPYVSGQNPFSFGTMRLVQCVTGTPTATATWIPTIPEAGYYNVYVSHAAFTNRSPEAQYIVTHAGGDSEYYIDQRRNRSTWIFIGRYFFEAGRDPNQAKVVLTNHSSSTAHYVSADAVRFGGGRGIISRGAAGTSPYPNHDNEAVYHLQFSGAPTSVYQSTANPPNDESKGWSGRPQYGRWLEQQSRAYGAPVQPAVFLSNHTNATSAGTARGTISYISGNATAGDIHYRYRAAVHNRVIANLTQGYGGNYTQNSNPLRSGNYGENNPNNTTSTSPSFTLPIFLGEWLFHDNASDMALYHDPKFRRMLARGVYQGMVDFFASEHGGNPTYLPEPPRFFRVQIDSPTQVTLRWAAPLTGPTAARGDAASGYKVYRSTHGRGFAGGTAATGTQTTITGLNPGTTYYFQLTATNAGGESFPTETLAVKMPTTGGTPRLLVVNGYDKLDIATRVHTTWGTSGLLYRQFLDQLNTQDYIVEHGRAVDASGYWVSYDSASHHAIEQQLVTLSNYSAIIWIGGIQAEVSTADPVDDTALRTNTRTQLTSYLTAGGKLFMTGAEIGWDLNRLGQSSFMQNTLRMNWSSDLSNETGAKPLAGGIFAGISDITFGTGGDAPYPVRFPDAIVTAGGSVAAMEYGSDVVLIDGFESLSGWQQPGFSGQTNADPSSSFAIASSPVRSGSGSGHLNYVWGTGNYIRQFKASANQVEFPAASDFSIWVHGDNSGHRLRICLRDAEGELFVNNWTTINFSGWQKITWPDIINNPQNKWAGTGNNVIDGPNVRFDSIHVEKVTAQNSGSLYFDDATYSTAGGGGGGPVAAVQYDGGATKLVYMGFPLETINDPAKRTTVMGRVLNFFGYGTTPVETAIEQWHVY